MAAYALSPTPPTLAKGLGAWERGNPQDLGLQDVKASLECTVIANQPSVAPRGSQEHEPPFTWQLGPKCRPSLTTHRSLSHTCTHDFTLPGMPSPIAPLSQSLPVLQSLDLLKDSRKKFSLPFPCPGESYRNLCLLWTPRDSISPYVWLQMTKKKKKVKNLCKSKGN